MSMYEPLIKHLHKHPGNAVKVTFEDFEDVDVIGIELPDSAKQDPRWWTDEATPQCRAWLNEGWEVANVDFTAEHVIFRRRQD